MLGSSGDAVRPTSLALAVSRARLMALPPAFPFNDWQQGDGSGGEVGLPESASPWQPLAMSKTSLQIIQHPRTVWEGVLACVTQNSNDLQRW